jgi:brefeldin A-resistance guanine nucleotide exchange factor 1
MRDQLYLALDALGGLPSGVLSGVAEQVVAGVALIVQRHRGIIRLELIIFYRLAVEGV